MSLKELSMSLSNRFEVWAKGHEQRGQEKGFQEGEALGVARGKAEGRQEGRQEGEQVLLQKLLTKRFGPLPAEVLEQLACASTEQIEAWADRVLDAASLDEVFRVH
jgi:predicted transposase YdaD